ncbi:MAG: hypothetical protein GVY36_08250 [Verrucomicrobia bacterium]|jgi:hypothetical protein|nr:hypothetical protein [Verrucomicrobiota bacterium]
MNQITFLKLFFALLACALPLGAQNAAVDVDRVKFNSLRNDWIQMEIELSCNGNPAPDARNDKFVEKIGVKAYIAYERDASAGEFDYYTSEVEIVIMERNDKNNVYFYLPGKIVERDRLKKEPDYYYVEITVDGESQTPQTDAMSRNISNAEVLNSFISRADSDGSVNEHLLMPIYLVSGTDLGRVSNLPTFLRRDNL